MTATSIKAFWWSVGIASAILFWFGATLLIFHNDPAGAIFAGLIYGALSLASIVGAVALQASDLADEDRWAVFGLGALVTAILGAFIGGAMALGNSQYAGPVGLGFIDVIFTIFVVLSCRTIMLRILPIDFVSKNTIMTWARDVLKSCDSTLEQAQVIRQTHVGQEDLPTVAQLDEAIAVLARQQKLIKSILESSATH